MITRRMSGDALCRLFGGERKNSVRRAARFERPGLLEVLAFEEQSRAQSRV